MSTPEQIIAEHQLNYRDSTCTCWRWSYAQRPDKSTYPRLEVAHAAHVVAALADAGILCVKLPEPDGTSITGGGYDDEMDPPGWTVTVRVPKEFACGWTLGDLAGHYEPAMRLGSALLSTAAARVAEGGDQP